MELKAQAQAIGFQRRLPNSFGTSNSIARLPGSRPGGLTMEGERKTDVTLRPNTLNTGMVRSDFPFVGSRDRRNAEPEISSVLRESGYLDAVYALIQAVNCGFERAIFGFRNVQNQVQDCVASLKGTGPVAFQSGWAMRQRRLAACWGLGLSIGAMVENTAEKQKSEGWSEMIEKSLQQTLPVCGLFNR